MAGNPYHAQNASYPGIPVYNQGFYAAQQQATGFQSPPRMHIPSVTSPGYPGWPYFTPLPENSAVQLHQFGVENERGFGPKMRSFLPWNQTDAKPHNHNGFQISIRERCPNKVNGYSCWEPYWHRGINVEEVLCAHLSDLLEHSREKFLKKRQCLPTMSCGIFMVGNDESQAQPRFVISCNDRHICKELIKIFKKHSLEAEYMGFKPLITTSFPRSQTPLQRLPERASSENSHSSTNTVNLGGDTDSGSDDYESFSGDIPSSSRQHDVFLRGSLLGGHALVLPAAVSIGSITSSHQAVISGLVTLQSQNRTFALTVAHAIHSPEVTMPMNSQNFGLSNSNGIKIGSVATSSRGMIDGLDWALIELDDHLEVCTLAPYPTRLASADSDFLSPVTPGGYKQVYIKTARSLISGRLLLNSYYIRPEGEDQFMHVWMVELNDPIHNGDCGSWVVGAENQEFYGYIAFGHPGDRYGYVISALSIFQQISTKMSDKVVPCASGPAFKSTSSTRDHRQSHRQQSPWNGGQFPPESFQSTYTTPQMPYHGYPLGYQGFYPQGFQPYSNPFSDRSNNGENKPPSVAPASTLDARDESASEDAIARLEKLILDERLERETKEAARLAAIAAAAAEKAAHENQIAHDRKIAEEAAALTMAAAESRLARLEEALKASEVKAAQETPKQRDLCIVQ